MRKPKQIFCPDRKNHEAVANVYRVSGQFAVIHDHREDYGCPGDCLMLNLPADVRAELSTEI